MIQRDDILSMEYSNVDGQLREIKKTSAKIILLINDKRLTDKIENYITNLNKFDTSKRAEHSTLI